MDERIERLETKTQRTFCTIKKAIKKKASRIRTKRKQKAAKRRIRRKQNRIKYYETIKKVRYQRNTEDLCSAVDLFDINDMEWAPTKYSSNLPTEIVDWHKQEQIAYWKSRAISLEHENRMLKQHLRNVYAQTIFDGSDVRETIEEHTTESSSDKYVKNSKKEVVPNLPEPQLKYRMEEMRKIYGDKAEKLISMETGIQLNYERHLEDSRPAYWPTLPLNL